MSRLVLGLDVGISSVGWGIIDLDTEKIVDSGVRLFAEGDSGLNANRRAFRSTRRLLRRKHHRIERIKKLLIENNIISNDFKPLGNPYEIRVKGLNNKLTNDELAIAILHIAKRRGITGLTIVDENDNRNDALSTKAILAKNQEELANKYVCEIQLERLKNGKVRNESNRFKTEDYIKELRQIFSNQNISLDLQDKIIEIIKSKREYYEGPGNEKSITPYGRFQIENGRLIEISMIDKMRGHCSIYPEEFRAPKMSYAADLFNFLNDLNNLIINGERIKPEEKREIIDKYINQKGSITPNQLAKYFGVSLDEISGFRVNEKQEPIITEFKGYKAILNCIKKNNLSNQLLEDKKQLDKIIEILTNRKGYEDRYNELIKIGLKIDEAETIAKVTGMSGYHSLSLKVMYEVIPDLLETEYNQMQIFQMNGYFQEKSNKYKGAKTIPFDEDAVLSSVAKRSMREALKIVDAIRKKYGELDTIVVEMPRDKNSEEEKIRIRKEQAKGVKIKEEIDKIVGGKQLNAETRLKVRLYLEQQCKCIYTNEDIELNTLINDPFSYEIDHIIPISISFDDSFDNKVVVKAKANQDKGQQTPYQYFKSGKASITYDKFKTIVLGLPITRKKKQLLLYEKDINKYENRKEFINRNLNDTRYASRVILNSLTNYFKANNINTKVHTIRGAVTSIFRKKAQIDKDRDESFEHHAVDALIISGIKKMKLFDNILSVSLNNNNVYDNETGEIITLDNEKEYYDEKFINFIKKLRKINPKYSHKIDSKPNRSMTDQTIYAVREYNNEHYIIGKFKDIYGKDGETVTELFRKGEATKLLMYKNDEKSYRLLEEIVNQYPNEKNPFQAYLEENKDYIRKRCKKGKGPIIRSLKYINKRLGSHMDISHKYTINDSSKVVLLQINPFRIDIYQEPNGLYKFLKINHDAIYKDDNNKYHIKIDWYQKEKENRNISNDAQFKFSLYKNDLFYYEWQHKGDLITGLVRYNGTDYNYNKIEYKLIDRNSTERQYLTIGKNIIKLEKCGTDILGQIYKIENKTCKFDL